MLDACSLTSLGDDGQLALRYILFFAGNVYPSFSTLPRLSLILSFFKELVLNTRRQSVVCKALSGSLHPICPVLLMFAAMIMHSVTAHGTVLQLDCCCKGT